MSESCFDVRFTCSNGDKREFYDIIELHAEDEACEVKISNNFQGNAQEWAGSCTYSHADSIEALIRDLVKAGAENIIFHDWDDSSGEEQYAALIDNHVVIVDSL